MSTGQVRWVGVEIDHQVMTDLLVTGAEHRARIVAGLPASASFVMIVACGVRRDKVLLVYHDDSFQITNVLEPGEAVPSYDRLPRLVIKAEKLSQPIIKTSELWRWTALRKAEEFDVLKLDTLAKEIADRGILVLHDE